MFGLLEQGQILINAAYGLVGVSVFIIAKFLLEEQESRAVEENLDERGQDGKESNNFIKVTRPFFSQYIVPMVRGKSFWDNQRKSYGRKLITAGLKNVLTPDEFISFKFFMILFFPLMGGFLNALNLLEVPWYYLVLSSGAGWFYPDLWISGRIKKRQKEILLAMPFIVDLLAVSTEAGLDFIGAIGRVTEKAAPSPLVAELEQVLKEIRVGVARSEALHEMANRVDLTQVSSFVAILVSAEQMGASIGKVLRQQSDQIRSFRFMEAEKAGAAASQKLILPLMIFIVPAVFLMIFGPWVLGFIYGTN